MIKLFETLKIEKVNTFKNKIYDLFNESSILNEKEEFTFGPKNIGNWNISIIDESKKIPIKGERNKTQIDKQTGMPYTPPPEDDSAEKSKYILRIKSRTLILEYTKTGDKVYYRNTITPKSNSYKMWKEDGKEQPLNEKDVITSLSKKLEIDDSTAKSIITYGETINDSIFRQKRPIGQSNTVTALEAKIKSIDDAIEEIKENPNDVEVEDMVDIENSLDDLKNEKLSITDSTMKSILDSKISELEKKYKNL